MSIHQPDAGVVKKLKAELEELDQSLVEVNGRQLKPSQCYRFEIDPMHIMYNTNCPDDLRHRVEEIFSKYLGNESSS
jgi:hypothetical protein